jgi:hypothetical protein
MNDRRNRRPNMQNEITTKECQDEEHEFAHRGVVWRDTGRRVRGSGDGATALEHFDLYFCTRCLGTVGFLLAIERDSYAGPLDGATPAPQGMSL